MSWFEYLFIIIGVCLNLFVAMECQGALIAKVNHKRLIMICLGIGLWQLLALFLGYYGSYLVLKFNPISDEALLGDIIAIVILLCLGCRFLIKAFKKDYLVERLLPKIELRCFLEIAIGSSLYTILSGAAFGLLGANVVMILVMIALVSVCFLVAGIYTGLHYGQEPKARAYIAGAILLWAGALDLILRLIL